MHSICFIYHNIQWFNGVHNQPICKNWAIWLWTFLFLASFAFHGWSSISLDCQMFIIHMILTWWYFWYVSMLTRLFISLFILSFLAGLQLCFLHPSKYKFEHPRFCFERLEYVGQKIQVKSYSCFCPFYNQF